MPPAESLSDGASRARSPQWRHQGKDGTHGGGNARHRQHQRWLRLVESSQVPAARAKLNSWRWCSKWTPSFFSRRLKKGSTYKAAWHLHSIQRQEKHKNSQPVSYSQHKRTHMGRRHDETTASSRLYRKAMLYLASVGGHRSGRAHRA